MADLNLTDGTVTDGGGNKTFLNPANANDGNVATPAQRSSFAAPGVGQTSILRTDLGAAFTVDSMVVVGGQGATGTNNNAINWVVQRSPDNAAWTTVPTTQVLGTVGGRGLTQITLDTPASFRYWRLHHTSGASGFQLNLFVNTWSINEAPPPASPPTANFIGTPLTGAVGTEHDFTDLSLGAPTSWLWDFGDGDTSTDQHPTHTYDAPGSYDVELTATNADGSDTETKVAYITVLPVGPGAILVDIFKTTDGFEEYQGTVTDASDRVLQDVKNGEGSWSIALSRHSANAALLVPDRMVKIRVPQIHSQYIFGGFLDAPAATLIDTAEQGGEMVVVRGRGGLAYWDNAIWLSDAFTLPWWACDDDPPSNAQGHVSIKDGAGMQSGGKYRVYTVAGGVITSYTDEDIGDECWYYNGRKTYQWPAENDERFLVKLLEGPHVDKYFHPNQQGVIDTRKTVATKGKTIELSTLGGTPGAVLRYMYDSLFSDARPANPLPLLSVDFTATEDSNGNPWEASDALNGMTANVGEKLSVTIGKLLATGVIDIIVDPNVAGLLMRAFNAPSGRDLTGAAYGAGVVRFQRGVGDGTGNIADRLQREPRDVLVATFTEIIGIDDVYAKATLPDTTGRVPREVSIEGDTNVEEDLEALGAADLEQRLLHAEATGFNVKVPRVGATTNEATGLYLPGPDYSDEGLFWTRDVVRLDTGTGMYDFDEEDVEITIVTISEDGGGNLRCEVELGAGRGLIKVGRYGAGMTVSPGSSGNSFNERSSGGSAGATETPDQNVHINDTADAHMATAVGFTPAAGIAATNVQAAIQEDAGDLAVVAGALVTHAADAEAHGHPKRTVTTTDPTVNDDSGDGYDVESRWVNTTTGGEFVALDVTVGAAVWKSTTDQGSGSAPAGTDPGDLLVWDGMAYDVLPIGPNGRRLVANDGEALGLEWREERASIQFVIDGGGSVITTGVKGYLRVPFACTIVAARLLADQSGSIVVDVWEDTYANYPPVDADSITASAPPTISGATKSEDTTLTGWTTALVAGSILGFNVDSITTCQRVTLEIEVVRT